MSDWLVSLEGTAAGHDLALMLALGAAVLHAIFGALQKGRADPWLSRAAIDACRRNPAGYAPKPEWLRELGKVSEGHQTTLGAYHRTWQ